MKFGLNFTLNLRNLRDLHAKFDGLNLTLNLLNLREFHAKFTRLKSRFNCDIFGGTILIVRNLRNLRNSHAKIYGVIKCVNFVPNLLNLRVNFTPNLNTKNKESKNA